MLHHLVLHLALQQQQHSLLVLIQLHQLPLKDILSLRELHQQPLKDILSHQTEDHTPQLLKEAG